MSAIDEIKQRLDIVTYVQAHVPTLKRVGRAYKACCPFHAEKTPSFIVNPDTQTWRCYGACGTGGDVIDFAMRLHSWAINDAVRTLADETGVTLKPAAIDPIARLYSLVRESAAWFAAQMTAAARAYLIDERGLDEDTLAAFGVGFAPDAWHALRDHLGMLGYTHDEMIAAGVCKRDDNERVYDHFRNRIIFPICDDRGQVRGFGGRVMPGDSGPKYINSPECQMFHKKDLLYSPMLREKNRHSGALGGVQVKTIVEGYLDAICAYKWGFKDVCAQMGTSLSDQQLHALAKQGVKTLILCLDSDAAGQSAMHRRAKEIVTQRTAVMLGMDIKIATLGTFKDPDEMIRANPTLFQGALDAARPMVDVLIDEEVSLLPADATTQQKVAKAREVMPLLRVEGNPFLEQEHVRKLAVALRLSERTFVEWAHRPTVLKTHPVIPPVPMSDSLRERAVLWGIIVNDNQHWIERLDSALSMLRPPDKPMPYAFRPLSPYDFRQDNYRALMVEIQKVMQDGGRPDDVGAVVKGTKLDETYWRIINGQQIDMLYHDERNVMDISLEQARRYVFLMRLTSLKDDMSTFKMTDHTRWHEAVNGVKILNRQLMA